MTPTLSITDQPIDIAAALTAVQTDTAGAVNSFIGTVRSLATAFQPRQQREAEGREGTTLHRRGFLRGKRAVAAAVRSPRPRRRGC